MRESGRELKQLTSLASHYLVSMVVSGGRGQRLRATGSFESGFRSNSLLNRHPPCWTVEEEAAEATGQMRPSQSLQIELEGEGTFG